METLHVTCQAAAVAKGARVRSWGRTAAAVGALAIGMAGIGLTATPAGAEGVLDLVSADGTGAPLHKTNGASTSDDGRIVAFVSNGDGLRNLLLQDRATGTTTEIGAGPAERPMVSGDGTVVVFDVPYSSVSAYDRATGATSVVSVLPEGVTQPPPDDTSISVHVGGVSNDGRFVVFSFRSSRYGINGVYLRDRAAGTTVHVSTVDPALDPTYLVPGPVSDDGTTVAFSAEIRIATHAYREFQTFVWTSATGTSSIVSVDGAGAPATRNSFVNDMTPDGRFVAFQSDAPLDPADPNVSTTDIYVHDRLAGTTAFVGANFAESDEAGSNTSASISDDGRQVAFVTNALIAGKTANDTDVVLADRDAGTVELLSRALDGTPAGAVAQSVELSGDGRFLTFVSSALDLVTPFDTSECVEYQEDEDQPWIRIPNYTECRNAYVLDRAATGGYVAPGGAITDGATVVQLPAGVSGAVTIAPAAGTNPIPTGYELLGAQIDISAPPATWDNPLRLTFTVPSSAGVPVSDVTVVRDGVVVADCIGSVDALPPDGVSSDGHPCVTERTTNGAGDGVLVVLTPHASVWSLTEASTPDVTFESLAQLTRTVVTNTDIAESLCAKLAKAAAAVDRDDRAAADRALDAYRRQVSAQSGKSIAPADAELLLEHSAQL